MADNVAITEGSGTTIAADEIAGVKYQRVKIALGADGAYDGDLDAGAAAASNSLPVTLATDGQFVTSMGSLTETPPATDTASSGINGRLQRLAQRFTTLLAVFPTTIDTNSGNKSASTLRVVLATDQPALTNAQPVTPAATESHLGEVGGNLTMISTEFTRPANPTAYTAGDVVSDNATATTMQALANAARVSGGSGYVTGIRITTDKKSITPRIRVHLFNTTGADVAADNAAWKSIYADVSKYVGWWDMPAMITGTDSTNSTNSISEDLTLRLPYTCAATSLYYVLETLDAFTPASGEKFTVTVFVDRN